MNNEAEAWNVTFNAFTLTQLLWLTIESKRERLRE